MAASLLDRRRRQRARPVAGAGTPGARGQSSPRRRARLSREILRALEQRRVKARRACQQAAALAPGPSVEVGDDAARLFDQEVAADDVVHAADDFDVAAEPATG